MKELKTNAHKLSPPFLKQLFLLSRTHGRARICRQTKKISLNKKSKISGIKEITLTSNFKKKIIVKETLNSNRN